MRRWVAVVVLVVGCATSRETYRQMVLPDGTHGFAVWCGSLDRCYGWAGYVCRGEYRIVDRDSASRATFVTHGNVTVASSGNDLTLIVQCLHRGEPYRLP